MATYTVSTNTNFHSLSGKAGNDTYNINGAVLTIDADTRYGPNVSVSTGPFGNITVSSSLGGNVIIDGSKVRSIAFSSGTGVVPDPGTTISMSGVSAELLCVMSQKTGGTVYASGTSMPVNGVIKVRNVTGGSFSPGVMSGIGATAIETDKTSFIEIVGVETKIATVPRLGSFEIYGQWFDVGTTSGLRNQTIQLPAFDSSNTWYPGVWIETGVGTGVYNFWANVATRWSSANFDADVRSRCVNITGSGLLYIGGDRYNIYC